MQAAAQNRFPPFLLGAIKENCLLRIAPLLHMLSIGFMGLLCVLYRYIVWIASVLVVLDPSPLNPMNGKIWQRLRESFLAMCCVESLTGKYSDKL